MAGSSIASKRSERRLAAIMFTDIVGYTALMAESEEKGLRARERHRSLVRPLVEKYDGEAIEARGDESLSVFPSALDAVNCALALQDKLKADPEKLALHIGIHQSDIVLRAGEVTGDGVNIAARICGLSDGSAPYISDEVQHAVQNQAHLSFDSLGEHDLKNVPRPVHVYRVTGAAQPPRHLAVLQRLGVRRPGRWLTGAVVLLALIGAGVWWRYRTLELSPIRSVAVLPLENFSGDPEQDYFADGMTDALIGDLAKIGALRVISRTSVMRYKATDKSLKEIAHELGVDGVVEGTVMRTGDRVRITAQLIDARSDHHVWSDRYDRDLSDVLALHSEVARTVAERIRLELTPLDEARLARPRSVGPRAHDAFMRGLARRDQGGVDDLVQAVGLFERSVGLDPDFAPAFAELAWSNQLLATIYGYQPIERMRRMRQAAERALELDPNSSSAHALIAVYHWLNDYDWDGAEEGFARALELDPNDRITLDKYAWFLSNWGRHREAIDLAERALSVAPFDLLIRLVHVEVLYYAERFERCIEASREILEIDPSFAIVRGFMHAAARELKHDPDELVQLIRPLHVEIFPASWVESFDAGYRKSGHDGAFQSLVVAMLESGEAAPAFFAALYAAFAGDDAVVVQQFKRSIDERSPRALLLNSWPALAPYRDDPRFVALLRRINHPQVP